MPIRLFVLLLLAACLTTPQTAWAVTWFVTPAGAGMQDGSAWAHARPGTQLQATLDNAASGDEVWVQAGTYRATAGSDRSASFHMRNGVTLYGSFVGTETLLGQRSLLGGPTSILSAEIGAPGTADNCYHVVHNTGLDASAVIDGFVIRDANDDRPASSSEGLGGGIFNDGSNGGQCSPTIRHCVITANAADFGAGIFNSGYLGQSSPHIEGCILHQNHAYTGGGGIDNFGLAGIASPTLVNTLVIQNTAAQRAGGMYCWGGNNGDASPVVLNSVFAFNSAVDGGGLVADNLNASSGSSGTAQPSFRNSILWGNAASGTGPQFFLLGSGGACSATYTAIDLSGQAAPHILSGSTTGNLGSDPLFLNSGLGPGVDGLWMTADDGFALQSLSPCRDVGDASSLPALDLLQAPRVNNGVVDLGAYEFDALPLAIVEQPGSSSFAPDAQGRPILAPNPSDGLLHILGASPSDQATLWDAQGRQVAAWQVVDGPRDFKGLPAGIYLLVVAGPEGRSAHRWVKR